MECFPIIFNSLNDRSSSQALHRNMKIDSSGNQTLSTLLSFESYCVSSNKMAGNIICSTLNSSQGSRKILNAHASSNITFAKDKDFEMHTRSSYSRIGRLDSPATG